MLFLFNVIEFLLLIIGKENQWLFKEIWAALMFLYNKEVDETCITDLWMIPSELVTMKNPQVLNSGYLWSSVYMSLDTSYLIKIN